MNSKWQKWFVGITLALILAGTAWLRLGGRHPKPAAPDTRSSVPTSNQTSVTVEPTVTSEADLELAARDLTVAKTAEERGAVRDRLRRMLTAGSTNEIRMAIRKLLDSNIDGPTGQGFKIGGGGSMLETPTLRTWLLDQLAALDPAAATTYAREILNSSNSPDEWAIALRNLARGDSSADARAFLESKTGELLRNESWQQNPSAGYLEAFDTAVYLGDSGLLPPLSDLVRKKDNQAVAHAAFLTLDRLVIDQPAQTLAALNEHPEWLAGREETRANYFARADVGDPEQRRLLEAYLLDATRSPAELQAFAGLFPNANFMISHNLLTANTTLDSATLRRRDQASLEAVNQWLADDKFQALKQSLARVQQRLQEFTGQAAKP